jgi:alpha-beta hydrolase superfamily lysophospholipase
MRRLLWTGKNSIRIRDETAQVLAKQLSAEHAEHPQATQLIIAHSHGGNIALRALHHLKQRDASQSSAEPLVVTLATPFVEVHHADLGFFRPFFSGGHW